MRKNRIGQEQMTNPVIDMPFKLFLYAFTQIAFTIAVRIGIASAVPGE